MAVLVLMIPRGQAGRAAAPFGLEFKKLLQSVHPDDKVANLKNAKDVM